MARLPRISTDSRQHFTQYQQPVFFEDRDRVIYLRLMREAAAKYGLKFTGVCLMINHPHLTGVPQAADALHLGMKWAHAAYARYVHAAYGGSGHLWQARYFSSVLAGAHTWNALAYVDLNPVQAGWWNALNALICPTQSLAWGQTHPA